MRKGIKDSTIIGTNSKRLIHEMIPEAMFTIKVYTSFWLNIFYIFTRNCSILICKKI